MGATVRSRQEGVIRVVVTGARVVYVLRMVETHRGDDGEVIEFPIEMGCDRVQITIDVAGVGQPNVIGAGEIVGVGRAGNLVLVGGAVVLVISSGEQIELEVTGRSEHQLARGLVPALEIEGRAVTVISLSWSTVSVRVCAASPAAGIAPMIVRTVIARRRDCGSRIFIRRTPRKELSPTVSSKRSAWLPADRDPIVGRGVMRLVGGAAARDPAERKLQPKLLIRKVDSDRERRL